MNFFGHCVVSSWRDSDPAFALGSMLPDFAHMTGARSVTSRDPTIARGITFHHRTDAAFHEGEDFQRLQSQAWSALNDARVPRGARLAIAHVGVELILDAELATDPTHRRQYAEALSFARTLPPSALLWRSRHDASAPFADLVQILWSRQQHLAPRDPHELRQRLDRILGARTRLALGRQSAEVVERWAAQAWVDVRRALPGWLADLRRVLVGVAPERPTDSYSASTP